jgi:hypothetical protein
VLDSLGARLRPDHLAGVLFALFYSKAKVGDGGPAFAWVGGRDRAAPAVSTRESHRATHRLHLPNILTSTTWRLLVNAKQPPSGATLV